MKILAQHGYGDGAKTKEGLEAGYIDGIVFRPRDISPEKLMERCNDLGISHPEAVVLFDPQFYAGVLLAEPNVNTGKLEEYGRYFERVILSRYESEANVVDALNRTLDFQKEYNLSGIIAPNIVIRRSFDSREAVIAKSFIRQAKQAWQSKQDARKVYATLAVSRDALLQRNEFQEFLNDITSLENPPDGFYLLAAAGSSDVRMELFNPELVSGWMLLNYTLKINGFEVINGYSDLLSPLLASVGGDYGCTGWWSNTRTFSLDQFVARTGGGSLPIQRYLCKSLLNRITFHEVRAWNEFIDVNNGLETDGLYSGEEGEPERAKEVLQSWEALGSLANEFNGSSIKENLERLEQHILRARNLYDQLNGFGIRPDIKSNGDHLEPLLEGIGIFRRLAEI